MTHKPIIDHYTINVAAKLRGATISGPYHHTALIVLRRGMTEEEALTEYKRYCVMLNITDPVYVFKCTMNAVHISSSHQVLP